MSDSSFDDLALWDKNHVWHPYDTFNIEKNLFVKSAKDDKLFLHDGSVIVDGISSWWVNLHGHSHPRLNQVLTEQSQLLPHVIFAGFTHEPAIKLAKGLLKTLPTSFDKVFYSDNGSTSTEVAIKMAIQFWHNKKEKRNRFIAFEGAYHGDTFGAMAVGGRSVYNRVFEPFLYEVDFIPVPTNENELEKALTLIHQLNLDQTAAFIYEPLLQGAAGMRAYPAAYLDIILKTLQNQHVLCIADEVFTGFFRTGKFWASDHCECKPDIICASKGLTGGYLPLGATICSKKISDAFDSTDELKIFMHGHSYTGNPLACALGVASLDLLNENSTLEKISKIVQSNAAWAEKSQSKHTDLEIHSIGTIVSVKKREGAKDYFANKRDFYYQKALQKGLLLRPIGETLYTVPIYCTSEETLSHIRNSMIEIVS